MKKIYLIWKLTNISKCWFFSPRTPLLKESETFSRTHNTQKSAQNNSARRTFPRIVWSQRDNSLPRDPPVAECPSCRKIYTTRQNRASWGRHTRTTWVWACEWSYGTIYLTNVDSAEKPTHHAKALFVEAPCVWSLRAKTVSILKIPEPRRVNL